MRNQARSILANRYIPQATYRIQFTPQFTFEDARALIPYLAQLGISDIYASPILKPRPGNQHGYDICDHSQINPALGGESGFTALAEALREHNMGLILDVVPNHMGINTDCNRWWSDVLENGPSSVYADYFDIDWEPPRFELHNRVLLPILGDQYGLVLERGELQLIYEDGAFFLRYYDLTMPLAPRSYHNILEHRYDWVVQTLGEDNHDTQEYQSITTALSYLPPYSERDPQRLIERHREKEVIKRRIARLYAECEVVRTAIDETLIAFNGTPGDSHSFDDLGTLLDQQNYRLSFWRVATEEINYRRFFDINDLAAIRVENRHVFDDTHRLIFELLAEGKVRGLRIDHPDGLWDPTLYFSWLQESYLLDQLAGQGGEVEDPNETAEQSVGNWKELIAPSVGEYAPTYPLYIVAEKILTDNETLPLDWTISGTTGYDFMTDVNNLFIARENEAAFNDIYRRFTGAEVDFEELVIKCKEMIMTSSLISEINTLAHRLDQITERNRRYRDFTLNSLIDALGEVIVHLHIYRTYIRDMEHVSERDLHYIELSISQALRRNTHLPSAIFDFLRDTLRLSNITEFAEEDRPGVLDFVMKFQQVTGPIMAKSMEDTAFYIYNRLVSLNEVGGHPEQFGISVGVYHEHNLYRMRRWPNTMLATSTHDTKRSEDVRARISILSEIPEEWEAAVTHWHEMNAGAKTTIEGDVFPTLNDEYLLYQTLIGTLPFGSFDVESFRDRINPYMEKAAQEAKVNSSWLNPKRVYLDALRGFINTILVENSPFLQVFVPFQRRIAYYGQFNALSQTLLKLTAPGLPDTYQGTELWDFSLVDPDNRRPVDYECRRQLLESLQATPEDRLALVDELLESSTDGRIKLYLIQRTLQFRRDHPQLFEKGKYKPLDVRGERWPHVCAFMRHDKNDTIIVIVPRLPRKLTAGVERPPLGSETWHDTWLTLPDNYSGRYFKNLFTDERVSAETRDGVPALSLASTLLHFPVTLLCSLDDQKTLSS